MTNLILVAALLAVWPFGGGKEFRMSAGTQVPAATGTVKVTKDKDNSNTAWQVKVEHLAKPASLTPAALVYIVWVHPRGAEPIKQGAIGVGNDLKGELKGVTVSKEFDFFITAEQNEGVTAPSDRVLLKTHVNVS